jgi:hypothetical protein
VGEWLSKEALSTFDDAFAEQVSSILLDLFPAHVAEALMRGEKVPPERKEMVTMYFSGAQ